MRSPWNLLAAAGIFALTLFSVLVIWPGYPKRYLPDFIDYPQGPIIEVFGRKAMKLGLDLNGGSYVLLEADTSQLPPDADVDQRMEGAKAVIEDRVNRLGIGETEISREGKNRLQVQLPGISPQEAAELVGTTAVLEFREPKIENGEVICRAADGAEFGVTVQGITETTREVNGKTVKEMQCSGEGGATGTVVWVPATCQGGNCGTREGRQLTGSFLTGEARAAADPFACQNVPPCVTINFTGEGSIIFENITSRLAQGSYPLAIFLDDELISAPAVTRAITSETAVITGLDSLDEAKRVAVQLNSGSLPVPMRVIQTTQVDATLGENVLVRTVQAGLIGIMAVMFFMVVYYRLPGVLASLALFTYITTTMMIFKLFPDEPVTITLPGIAGFVLSVGMAVDANILVFERMKEELRAGRSLASAIDHGFDRAWTSIRDSNVSTLITAFILWWFGDRFGANSIEGFAIVLAIGVLVSMFSAIVVTRTLLRLLIGTPVSRYPWLFAPDVARPAAPVTSERRGFVLDFVRRRGFYFALSALLLVPGLISLAVPPSLKPGIEFTSGATFTVAFQDKSVDQDDLKEALAQLGYEDARVQKTAAGAFIVRIKDLRAPPAPPVGPPPLGGADEIRQAFVERFGPIGRYNNDGTFTETGVFQNFSSVSEIVSREIARDATIAVATAAVAILAYISWSFRNVPKAYRYGIAAIVAALHDAVFILGAFSIFGKLFDIEVNSMFITGLLTVIGFSVHDTIVVFDRIRENVARYPDAPFDEVVNASLTETVARSINTSFTVVITVVSLLLLGGEGIDELLIALLLGIVAGTYSSIFIASQILVAWEDGDFARLFRRIWPRRAVPAEAPG
jgi:protein-export membrane protein SecD/preprotein translocase SecF subunit